MNKIPIPILTFVLLTMYFNFPMIIDNGFHNSYYSVLPEYNLSKLDIKSQNDIAYDFFSDMMIEDIDYTYKCSMKDGNAKIKITSDTFDAKEYYLIENHFCTMDKWDSLMRKYGINTFNVSMAKSDGWMLFEYDYIVDLESSKAK